MNGTTKIVRSIVESDLLMEGVNETIKNEAKKQKSGFLGMSLSTLGASLLGNMLAGRGVVSVMEYGVWSYSGWRCDSNELRTRNK